MFCLAIQYRHSYSDSAVTKANPVLNVWSTIMADIPTLLLISSFSAFAYYLSKLSSQIELAVRYQHSGPSQAFFGIHERITGLPGVAQNASNQENFRRGNYSDGPNFAASPRDADSYIDSEGFN